jgi:hypothetical protein
MPIQFDINKLKQEEASRDASEGPVFSSSPLGSTVREGNLDKYRDEFTFGVPLGESENPILRLNQYMNDTQGGLNKFGSMVARGLLKIPTGLIGAVGGLIEIPEVLTKTSDFDNILLQISNKGREGIDELMPDYYRGLPGSERFDPGSFEWLMANGDTAIESVGFSLLGMALSGGSANVIRALGASVNAAKIGGALTGAILMNHSEGIMEASHTYKTLIAKGVSNDIALESAYKAVHMNRLAMGFEFAQQLSLLRGFKYATSFKDAGKSYATRKLSQYGGMMGSEAMEEIWTGFSNSEAERFGMLKAGKEADTGSSFASRFVDYALSSEGLTEGFMGAIGGAGMTFVRNRIDDVSNMMSGNLTREQQYQATSAFINQNPDAIKDLMGEGKGNKFENAKKQFDANTKLFEQMQDAVDNGDTKLYHRLQKQAYAGLAYNNAQQGTLDQFRRTTETLLSMTEEEATEHNINYEELQKNKKEYLDVINTVEKVYDKVENTFSGSDSEIKNTAFNNLYNLEIIPTIIKKNGVDIQNIYSENSQFGATQLNINNTVNQLKALQILKKQREVVASQLTGEAKIKIEKEIAKIDKKIDTTQKNLDRRLNDWNTQFTLEGTVEDNYNSFFGEKKHKAKDFEHPEIDGDLILLHASTENLKLEHEDLTEQYNKLKDPKQRELLETEIQEKRAADQKIERDKAVKQAKTEFANSISKATTVDELNAAFIEFQKTPAFKSLSNKEKDEIKKQYSQTRADFIKNNKAKPKPKPNTTNTDTDTTTDEDDTDTETGNKATISEDQPNPSDKEIDRLNKSQADTSFKKKNNILSFAWLNVLYTIDKKDGTIVDLFDEDGQLKFENIGDPRILDYDRLFNGDELEIFIDTAYATANGIPIDEANAYRIPYGIRFKGSLLTAAYIHTFTNPITNNSIDPNIERFIGNENIRATEQSKLDTLRNNLFKQLSSNPSSSVVSAKINDISKGAFALSEKWESSSTRLDSDTLFGIVNSNGNIDIINKPEGTEDKYVTTYVGTPFPSGALVAMLPSYAKNERKIVLVPSILKTDTLTDEDIKIALHIIQNFNRYSGNEAQTKFGVRGDDLLNNILYNGNNTTKFKISVDKKSKKRLLYRAKSGNNWNTADAIDVENTEALITFLNTQRYNVQNKDYIKLEATKDAEGNITEITKGKTIPFNEWVLTHTTTNINSFTITDESGKDTGRKGYFVQPVIGFEFNPASTSTQSSTTSTQSASTTTTSDREANLAALEKRRQEELDNIGQKVVQVRLQELREATSEKQIAQAIINVEKNVKAGAKITKEEQDFVNQKREELKNKGVEILDPDNKVFDIGLQLTINNSRTLEENENLTEEQIEVVEKDLEARKRQKQKLQEQGLSAEEIDKGFDDTISIMTTVKPQINKNDKMIQSAIVDVLQIEVSQAEEILERSKKNPKNRQKEAENRINAKYDRLAALEGKSKTPTSSTNIDAEIAKIEKRRQEEYTKEGLNPNGEPNLQIVIKELNDDIEKLSKKINSLDKNDPKVLRLNSILSAQKRQLKFLLRAKTFDEAFMLFINETNANRPKVINEDYSENDKYNKQFEDDNTLYWGTHWAVRNQINAKYDALVADKLNQLDVQSQEEKGKSVYLSIPNFDGSFNDSSASTNYKDGASIYRFTKISNNTASFRIENKEASVQLALQFPDKSIYPVCNAENAFNPNAKSITTITPGIARLEGGKWIIERKAEIRYEAQTAPTSTTQTETSVKPPRKPQVVNDALNMEAVLDGDVIGSTTAQTSPIEPISDTSQFEFKAQSPTKIDFFTSSGDILDNGQRYFKEEYTKTQFKSGAHVFAAERIGNTNQYKLYIHTNNNPSGLQLLLQYSEKITEPVFDPISGFNPNATSLQTIKPAILELRDGKYIVIQKGQMDYANAGINERKKVLKTINELEQLKKEIQEVKTLNTIASKIPDDIKKSYDGLNDGDARSYYAKKITENINTLKLRHNLTELKNNTTFDLNSELTSVNPAIAAEVNRIATATNKYQAAGDIILQANDEELNSIMFKVFDALNGKEPRITFHFENNKNLANYDASIHTVSVNKATIAKSKRALAYVLAHEFIHAATVNKLKISSNRAKFQPLFDKAKSQLGSNPKYRRAFKNIEEFVAEAFSNTEFKKDLQSIKVDNRNWFTKFIDFIKSLFGYTADTTFLYDLVYKSTEELLASSESEVSEDSFDLYDNFLVPGLTVYQTEEMLKTISYIRIQVLRKNKNTTEKELDLIVKNEINRAYNKLLKNNSVDIKLDLFDVIIGTSENEEDKFNTDTYKKLTERSINYIKGISEFIREDSRVWDETNDVESNDTDELSDDENTDSDSKERVYDKSPFEDNPKDSASKRLKSYLATQPKVAFTADRENIYVVGNMFNMASLIPFDVLYNTLVDNLANTPTNKIFDKLEKLSKYNPQIKKVYNELKQFRESGDLDKVAIYKEFISNFSGQKVKFVTSQFTKFDGNNSYRVLYSNRNNSQSILIDQWHNNFKYNSTDITKVIKGETIVNKEKAEALHKEFKDSITFNKDTKVTEKDKIVKAIELLNRIGISLSSEEISLMLTTDPGLVEKDYTVKKFLDSADYIIKSLSSKQIITEEDSDLQRLNDNPFIGAESKNLLSLAKVELTVNNNLFSTMFRNEQGKSISAIFKNTVISKIAQEMFDSTSTIYKNMEQSAFHSNSWIFNQIKKGIVNANNFEIDVFSTINERFKVKGSAKTFKQMSAKERLINKIIMYANEGQNKAYYQFPTQSDKTWVPILGMNRVNVTIVDNKVNKEVLDAFYSIFAQEMYRIIDVKNFYANNERSKMIENYHVTYDKKLKKDVLGFGGQFTFLPNFNSDDITVTIGSGDLAVERAINDLNADELALPEVKAQILDKLNGEVLELIEKERTDLVKNGILHENGVLLVKDKSISKGANKDHFGTNFVANYAVNYALAYNSIYTLFNNDPAFAKDWSDIIKRGAMNLAPGSDLTNEGSFGVAIIKDKKVNSTALEELTKVLPSLTDDNTSNKIISALTDIEYTDAQAWCSLKHYKSFLSGLGRLTDRVDKIITALQNDKNITQEEMTELLDSVYGSNFVLQPQKPVYVYDTWDPVSKTLVRRYLKYSVFPLFKQLTKDHPELDSLRKKIDASNSKIELVIAKSGVKEGAQFVTEAEDISNDTIINIPWRGLSLQQETPYDKNKMKINTVSQARKLLFGDLLNFNLAFTFNGQPYQTRELKDIYDNLFKASIEEEYEKLSNELDIDENGNITNLKLIRNLLADEGIRKNYDENFLESLKVENNKFNIPLWISTYSDQIESLLTSIITNRIVKQKMPGRSFVQGSPFGFSKENIISTSSKKAIAALKGMGISNDKVTDEGIYLPNIFDGLEGFKTGDILTEEMLKVVGFRIPNQGHNSMANLKIAGFLPKEVGDLVIVSPDMLVRMGSDFDVDKLYLYIKNAKRVYKEGKYYITPYVYNDKVDQVDVRYKEYLEEAKGKVLSFEAFSELSIERQNSKKARQNAIIDIYMEILSKKELAPRIMRPNDIKELEKVNNRVLELQGKDNNPILNLLSPSAQDEMFESNIAGKSAVGTTSLWSTFLAQVQYYENFGIRIYKQLQDGTKVLANEGIKFKDSEGNLYNDKLVLYRDSSGELLTEEQAKDPKYKDLVQLENIGLHKVNKVKGVVNDSFISDIIQILQSAAVDNSKEQQMTKGHINDMTLNPAMLMAMSGIDSLPMIISFIAQPYIVSYVKAVQSGKSITSTFTSEKAEETEYANLVKTIEKQISKLGGTFKPVDNESSISAFSLKELEDALSDTVKYNNKSEEKVTNDTLNNQQKVVYLQRQYEILHAFKYYMELAQNMNSIVNNMNVDTKSIGKNFIEVSAKNDKITSDIKGNSNFIGVDKLWTNTIPGIIHELAVSKSLTIYNDPNLYPKLEFIKYAVDKLKAFKGLKSSDSLSNKDLEGIKRAANHFVTNALNGLFKDESISQTRNRLINGNDNVKPLHERLLEYQKESVFSNWLLQVLTVDPNTNAISYPSVKIEGNDTVYAIASLVELLNSDDPNVKVFAEDLIKYSFLTSGNNKSKGGLSNIIPIEYLLEKQFGKYYNNDMFIKSLNNPDINNRFLDQYIRNNPTAAFRLDKTIFSNIEGVLKIRESDLIKKAGYMPKYVYVFNKDKKGEITLFGLIGTEDVGKITEVNYQALNILNNEYALEEDLMLSVYEDNNKFNPFLISDVIALSDNKDDTMIGVEEKSELQPEVPTVNTESATVTPTTKSTLASRALTKTQAGDETTPTDPIVKKPLAGMALRANQVNNDLNNENRTIKVEQFNITIKSDGKMFYDNGNEVTDQTTKNKVNVRKELQDGTLRTSTYNGANYFILSDNRIVGSGTTNLGKESINNPKTKETILATAIKYKPNCK